MAQLLVPVSDQATGLWTNAPLWSKTDADDNTDAISDAAGNNADTSNADLKLDTGADPEVSTGHTLRARWHHDTNNRSMQATAELYQGDPASGGTLIATLQSATNVGTTEVEDTYTLTGTEADSITDYSDLYVRLRGRGTGGGPSRSLHVDLVELSIPDASLDRLGQISFAELEAPGVDTTAQVSFAELETGDVPGPAGHITLDGDGDYVETPDSGTGHPLDFSESTTDAEFIALIAADDYANGTQAIISKHDTQQSAAWRIRITSTGLLELDYTDTGFGFNTFTSTESLTANVANGDPVWVRVLVTFDSGLNITVVSFYWSNDPLDTDPGSVSWTPLGDSLQQAGSLEFYYEDDTNPRIGAETDTGGSPDHVREFAGKMYGVWVWDTGTLAADPDFRDDNQGWSGGSGTDSNGSVWTLNGDATWVAGTSDRAAEASFAELEVPDAPRAGQVSHAELETADAGREGQISFAELEVPTAPRQGQISFAELETTDAPRQGQISFAEFETEDAPRSGQVSWAELETEDAARTGQISFAELEAGDAPRSAQISFTELETEDAARTGQISHAEFETGDAPRQGQVSFAELETEDAAREGQVSFAELEAPTPPAQGQVSFAALETPDAPTTDRRSQISFAELETEDAGRSGQVSFAEFETGDAPRSGQVSFAELETEDAPRAGQVSHAALETEDAPRSGQISFAELETDEAPRQGQISFAELETADAPRSGQVSFAEFETPEADRSGQVSYATLETPDAPSTDRKSQISFAELETAEAPRSGQISFAEMETDDAPRSGQISYAEMEAPTAPRRAEVSHAELEATEAPRAAQLSFAELETDDQPRSGQLSFAEMETPDAARSGQVSFAELETDEAPRSGQISFAALETPNAPGESQAQVSWAEFEAPDYVFGYYKRNADGTPKDPKTVARHERLRLLRKERKHLGDETPKWGKAPK